MIKNEMHKKRGYNFIIYLVLLNNKLYFIFYIKYYIFLFNLIILYSKKL
jgi:hypothetical protein